MWDLADLLKRPDENTQKYFKNQPTFESLIWHIFAIGLPEATLSGLVGGPDRLRSFSRVGVQFPEYFETKMHLKSTKHVAAAVEIGRGKAKMAVEAKKSIESETNKIENATTSGYYAAIYEKSDGSTSKSNYAEFLEHMMGGIGQNVIYSGAHIPTHPDQAEIDSKFENDKTFLDFRKSVLESHSNLLRDIIYPMLEAFIDPLLLAILDYEDMDFEKCCGSADKYADLAWHKKENNEKTIIPEKTSNNQCDTSSTTSNDLRALFEKAEQDGEVEETDRSGFKAFEYKGKKHLESTSKGKIEKKSEPDSTILKRLWFGEEGKPDSHPGFKSEILPDSTFKQVGGPRIPKDLYLKRDLAAFEKKRENLSTNSIEEESDEKAAKEAGVERKLKLMRQLVKEGDVQDGCFTQKLYSASSGLLNNCCTFEMLTKTRRGRGYHEHDSDAT